MHIYFATIEKKIQHVIEGTSPNNSATTEKISTAKKKKKKYSASCTQFVKIFVDGLH